MNIFKKFDILSELYGEKYYIGTAFAIEFSYGTDRAVEILENAKGRKIELKYVEGTTGKLLWRYDGETNWQGAVSSQTP